MKDIPITKISAGRAESDLVKEVVKSGWVTQGPMVGAFEKALAKYIGAKYAIAVSSGTAALHLGLLLSGVDSKDEVITTSLSFIATSNSIIHAGAIPAFVDISPVTYNISAAAIREFITKGCVWKPGKRTLKNRKTDRTIKAIMPVDQVGLPAELDEINAIAKEYGLSVVEDAACALGSEFKKRKIGSISPVSCFSFHPRKIITTGEGGAITTNDAAMDSLARSLRSHGLDKSGRYSMPGYNYRLSDIHAAFGIAQMAKLDGIIKTRRRLAGRYNDAFAGLKSLTAPCESACVKANFQSYILRLNKGFSISRDSLIKKLAGKGIHLKEGIMACHLEPYYKKITAGIKLPITEEAARSTVLLPLYPALAGKEQDEVIRAIKSYA